MNAKYKSDEAWLTYRDEGDGLPVVFLHPTPVDGEYWRPLAERLNGIRAIIPDLRGHGGSELGGKLPVGSFAAVPDAPVLSMGQLADDALILLDRLGVGQAVFAGCSIGGYVLMEIWRRAPKRVRGLAVVCSKPQPDTEVNLSKRAATIAQARAEGVAAIFDGMAKSLIGASARARTPEIVEELRARMTLTREAVVAVQAGLATRPDSVPTAQTIGVPVLAIAGGEDPGIAPAEMEAYLTVPGGCDFHLLPDAGHFAAYEQPNRVAVLMRDWLVQNHLLL